MKTLELTTEEIETLKNKLERLMKEVNHGVDVWLAPGGAVNLELEDDVFVDYDEEGVNHLNSVLAKLQAVSGD